MRRLLRPLRILPGSAASIGSPVRITRSAPTPMYAQVVVNIFTPHGRELYALDDHWTSLGGRRARKPSPTELARARSRRSALQLGDVAGKAARRMTANADGRV